MVTMAWRTGPAGANLSVAKVRASQIPRDMSKLEISGSESSRNHFVSYTIKMVKAIESQQEFMEIVNI